jgi:hypothetical protein
MALKTFAPCAAKYLATDAPFPFDVPVTKASLFSNSLIFSFYLDLSCKANL